MHRVVTQRPPGLIRLGGKSHPFLLYYIMRRKKDDHHTITNMQYINTPTRDVNTKLQNRPSVPLLTYDTSVLKYSTAIPIQEQQKTGKNKAHLGNTGPTLISAIARNSTSRPSVYPPDVPCRRILKSSSAVHQNDVTRDLSIYAST